MKSIIIPGYRHLYGHAIASYEELLQNFSSNTVLMVLAGLNAELNTNESHKEKQRRLLSTMTHNFTTGQRNHLLGSLIQFNTNNPDYDGSLFARRYLLSMVLKEIERNNIVEDNSADYAFDYQFLSAYLMIVDEANEKDNSYLEDAKRNTVALMPAMPLIWAVNISQYEFNESSNPGFEFFKLLSFCKYAYDNHKLPLKELINKRGFNNLSNYLGSSFQLAKATLTDNPKEFLRRLYFINPKPGTDITYLKVQSVNPLLGNKLKLSDLKKSPLFETKSRGFMIVDEDIYKKRIYRGALFDLHKETSLKKVSFDDYKNDVSLKCFENILFKGITEQLRQKSDTVHYDSGSKVGDPDLYCRSGSDVFLIEFKDYLFPDSILASEDFKTFEKYINERLVLSNRGKPKGIGQLVNNIASLLNMKYTFDPEINDLLKNNKDIQVHSIICHTDFMFGMPGVNEYLNNVFKEKILEKGVVHQGINVVTLVSLEVLYDLALRKKGFSYLLSLIKRYHSQMYNLREKYKATSYTPDFMASTSSFDGLYSTRFRNELIDYDVLGDKESVKQVTSVIGITQEQLDETL